MLRFAALFYGFLFAAALLWRRGLYGEPLWLAPGGELPGPGGLAGDVVLGLAVASGVIAASHGLTRHTRVGEVLARRLARALGPLSTWDGCVLALFSAIGEEAFFRGALQPRVGLLGASLLFGLAHFVPRWELVAWSGFSLVAGLLLGVLFDSTGNLVAPVVAHFLVNAVNLNLLVREYGPAAPAARAPREELEEPPGS